MNNDFFNEEFLSQDQDPIGNDFLREVYEAELEQSMRWSYSRIEKMGIDKWFQVFPFSQKKKERIVENMMLWFAHEEREEYEKSAYLKTGLDRLKQTPAQM